MNTLKNRISFAIVATALMGAASAHAAVDNPNALPEFDLGTPKTSQQVQQELNEARAAGQLATHPNALPKFDLGQPESRAQVKAELAQARAAGLITPISN